MRQAGGYFPLLEFVREVAASSARADRTALDKWFADAARALAIDDADAAALVAGGFARPRAAAGTDNYLLVRFEDADVADRWRVQAWLFGDDEPQKLFEDELDLGRADLSGLVYRLLDCMESLDLSYDSTTLGVLAPRAFLVEGLDQISPAMELTPEPPIGSTLAVTVRSLERLGARRTRRHLEAAWQALKAAGNAARPLEDRVPPSQPGAAVWLQPADAGPALIAELQKHAVTCAVLSIPPGTQPSGSYDLFNCALQGGVPAIVWVRDPVAANMAAARAQVAALLNDATAALPQRVWQRRQAAGALNDPTHPNNCLVLLWDDAERTPPDQDPANRAAVARS
jgi:hypothetical protein